jgi:hypothetical protein
VNASDVIDDRVVLESGNTQYLACIIPDFDPGNPLKDWDQSVSFYVPEWDGRNRDHRHIETMLDSTLPTIPFKREHESLYERTMNASWYDDVPASEFLKLFRRNDPSGLYFIVNIVDDRMGYRLYVSDDDDDSTCDYAIAYRTSEEIRKDFNVKRITRKVREQAESNIRADVKTQNAYFAGDVYGYYVLRQVLDDDGETISSEEVEGGSCYGYYGSDEWEYMYSEAKAAAEHDYAQREEAVASSRLSLDLFDAASYPEPSMYDVAGAYQARLQEGFEAIGACTRKLKEEGYWNTGTIAIG